jgi:CRISPR system Cascade subunit CasB
MSSDKKPPQDQDERFVEVIIDRCKNDRGMAARLRRADNPATEYQSWELLGSLNYLGVDLEMEHKRLPFVTVAAAIARSKCEHNGNLTLGKAIADCYRDGSKDSSALDQAKARLRRLLACDDLAEACRILRPILTLIDSRVNQPLNYVRLLSQLRWFNFDSGYRTKAQWAQEFYGQYIQSEDSEGAA